MIVRFNFTLPPFAFSPTSRRMVYQPQNVRKRIFLTQENGASVFSGDSASQFCGYIGARRVR
jgi:hypothetical protein